MPTDLEMFIIVPHVVQNFNNPLCFFISLSVVLENMMPFHCICNQISYFITPKTQWYSIRICRHCEWQTYQCGYCGAYFSRKDNLSRHVSQTQSDGIELPYQYIDKHCKRCQVINSFGIVSQTRLEQKFVAHDCIK